MTEQENIQKYNTQLEKEKKIIHEYLFDRYNKLVVDVNNPSILKQDNNDKKFNIIDLIGKYSHCSSLAHLAHTYLTPCSSSILHNLLSKYIKNCSFPEPKGEQELNISKKEYYDKYILEDINQIYNKYKIYLFNKNIQHMPESRFGCDYLNILSFIDELLQGIKKDKEEKNIEQHKLEDQQKLEEQRKLEEQQKLVEQKKLEKQKKLEEKQKLDKQKKSEEKQKLDKQKKSEEKQKLDKQKKSEEENLKLKQELQKQSITKSNSDCEAHKKKKKPISATIKRLVWNTNIGEQIGKAKCMCCNVTDITQMSFNCGHIIAESNGGETVVSNLKPICQNCNSSMGIKDMEEFIKTLK